MKRSVCLILALAVAGCSKESANPESATKAKAPSNAPAADPKSDVPIADLAGLFNNVFQDGDLYVAGKPKGVSSFAAIKAAGVTTVVDLLGDGEHSDALDEKAAVEAEGMRYVHIPVSPATLSKEDVARFGEAMTSADGKVLLHCASANRAGGVYAAWLASTGLSIDDALARGKAVGLKAPPVIEAVRRVSGSGE